MWMEPSMKVNGGMINSMVTELKLGLMALGMKVITKKEKNMVKVLMSGKMDQDMKETGSKIRFQDM